MGVPQPKRLLLVKYINILLYLKEKSNFVVNFTSMFSCFRRPGVARDNDSPKFLTGGQYLARGVEIF